MNCRDERITDMEKSGIDLVATIKALLADHAATQQQGRSSRRQRADSCADDWNVAHTAIGSFADEHSTIDGVVVDPTASVAFDQLGEHVASLANNGQAIADALDELLTRTWG